MYDIEVATLFLMLVSGITRIVFGFESVIKYLVKSMKMSILNFCVFTVHCMKREMIR